MLSQVDIGTDELQKKLEEYGTGTGQIIDNTLRGEGAQVIIENILPLIHSSGRTWRGKKPPAKMATNALEARQKSPPLSVIVGSNKYYNYLYFPDDGSNTARHYGNQNFMMRGAQNAAADVTARCINNLIKNFEK